MFVDLVMNNTYLILWCSLGYRVGDAFCIIYQAAFLRYVIIGVKYTGLGTHVSFIVQWQGHSDDVLGLGWRMPKCGL